MQTYFFNFLSTHRLIEIQIILSVRQKKREYGTLLEHMLLSKSVRGLNINHHGAVDKPGQMQALSLKTFFGGDCL